MSATTHSRPRPKKLELDEINFVSNTASMTVIDSRNTDYFDNEYSNQYNSDYSQCGTWIIEDYDSNWRKYTNTTLSNSFQQY